MKIGFFDSGLGGLTLLKAVRDLLPQYDYIYFGDTVNLPYGSKSEDEIYQLAFHGIQKLFAMDAELVIIACNTVSAESLRRLQDTVFNRTHPERRVLGVIIPTIEAVLETRARDVLLIGTTRTIESNKYEYELKKLTDTIRLQALATPYLVPLIEEHKFDKAVYILRKDIEERVGDVETLILGCTHYTLLKEALRMIYPEIRIFSQDEIIPEKLKNYLFRHSEIESILTRTNALTISLSKESERYDKIKKVFFGI